MKREISVTEIFDESPPYALDGQCVATLDVLLSDGRKGTCLGFYDLGANSEMEIREIEYYFEEE